MTTGSLAMGSPARMALKLKQDEIELVDERLKGFVLDVVPLGAEVEMLAVLVMVADGAGLEWVDHGLGLPWEIQFSPRRR
jgi:hypothetical protein